MPVPLPQAPPVWTHRSDQVLSLTKDAIADYKGKLDAIVALKPEDLNFTSVFETLAHGEYEIDAITEPLSFYQNVSGSKELRDASNDAEKLVRDFSVESSMRLDVFNAKVTAEKNIRASGEYDRLSPEQRRLIEKMILDGTRAGLALPEDQRQELTALKKELSQVCLEFNKNFNEESGRLLFSAEELDGVPKDIISGYPKKQAGDKELHEVTFKTPDIIPIYKYATNPETRRLTIEGNEGKLEVNVPLFEKALELRKKIVGLLGYKNWAEYITEIKMVKNATGVINFLDDLQKKLTPVGEKDRDTLLKMKEAEYKAKGLPFDGQFYLWDYRYYDRKFIEETLDLDEEAVKEYFPVSVVVPAIMEIYETMLGVKFVPLTEGGDGWHPEVQQYSLWSQDATDESGFFGFCYLDLFPRDGKYSHAAVWPLIPACDTSNGKSYPIAAMVANLAKPTPDKPALMKHDDVVTFFHEMGHVFHGLLSRTKYSRFHGTSVARDFVEAPSQMLENWCWEPKVLKKMSSHYESQEPLSDDLISKIIKSRYVNNGLFNLRQLFFGKFDITVHTTAEKQDYTKLWNELRQEVSLVKNGKVLGPGQGTFGHLMGGYDAGYYGYLYSLVFASDMYATVFKADPLDPARGAKYRKSILGPGGSRDELDSLKEFLGREPNSDAFLEAMFGKDGQKKDASL